MKNNKMASLGVKTQFLIAGLVVLAGLAFMAIAGVFAVSSKTDSMSDQADFQQQVVGTMVVSAELRAQVQTHLIAYKDLLLRGSDTSLKAAQEQALAQSDKRITEGFSQLKTQLERMEVPDATAAALQAEAAWTTYRGLRDSALQLFDPNNFSTVMVADTPVRDVDLPILQGLDQVVAVLKEDLARQVEQDRAAASAGLKMTLAQLLGVAVLVMLVIVAVGMAIARALWRTLGTEPAVAASIALRIAEGNLDTPIPQAAPGSLLAALAQTQQQLREVLARIRDDANRLSGAAQTLAGMSARLEESTGDQTQSASAVASSVQQMTVGIDQVSTHSGQALEISRQSGQWSDDGNQAARRAMSEMERIAGSASDLSGIVEALGSRSEEIGRIVHVIQEIAGQTNLLALNAAIEAARAGEQGRGFSVVADEVRKLAERTTESTQEISAMIAAIQSGTAEAVSFVTQWSGQVAGGLEQVRTARDTLERVKQGADQVVDAVNQISTTLAEQQSASTSIAQRVDRIARMSQDNAGAVSQLAQASRDLEQLSGGLRAAIAHFRVGR